MGAISGACGAKRRREGYQRGIGVGVVTRGRRPTPTRLKYLTGNPGKRPLNPYEPRPEPSVPECPPELGPAAKREWERLVGDLARLNLLTNLDRAALAAYCGAYSLWADATEQIQKYGAMIKSPTGYPVQSP